MNQQKYRFLVAVALSLYFICFLPARAGIAVPYKYLITIELVETDELNYDGSPLAPVTEALISCSDADGSNEYAYETIWYCKGQAYGLERHGDLEFGAGQPVAIKVVHKDQAPIQADFDAAANAIIRMFLDVNAGSNVFLYASVPDDSIAGIVASFSNEHFYAYTQEVDRPYQLSALMLIKNESGTSKTSVCYAPTSSGAQ